MDLFEHASYEDSFEEEIASAPRVLQVRDLARAIKDVVEGSFGVIQVEGELSGGKVSTLGHYYGDLRDDEAVINCVAWKSTLARLGQMPANGTRVIVTGELTTYPARSSYQLKIIRVETAGLGALIQQIEALKKALHEEGLLDAAKKRALPWLPKKIGLVTSPKGAVLSDMLHRIEDRCPVPVMLWPVAVQGPTAPQEIAAAVNGFSMMDESVRPDIVIVARGGGSFEDLMAFNSEVVARAIAGCSVPVISGVGHEPDVTIADLVADVRAPTPTAAAEMAVPVRDDIWAALDDRGIRLERLMERRVELAQLAVDSLRKRLLSPQRMLDVQVQRLDMAAERLQVAGGNLLRGPRQQVEALERLLQSLTPLGPLQRGFALVRGADGKVVKDAQAAAQEITLQFKDGTREGSLR